MTTVIVTGVVTVNGQRYPVTDVYTVTDPPDVFDTATFDTATFE